MHSDNLDLRCSFVRDQFDCTRFLKQIIILIFIRILIKNQLLKLRIRLKLIKMLIDILSECCFHTLKREFKATSVAQSLFKYMGAQNSSIVDHYKSLTVDLSTIISR